jgi:muconate cycloisomerase
MVAEANGLGLLGSGLTETGVGLIAAIHLFSTLELQLPPELNRKNEVQDDLRANDLRQQRDGIKRDGQTSSARDRRPVVG